MREQTGRFIDDDQFTVLIEDFERDLLRRRRRTLSRDDGQTHAVARLEAHAFDCGGAVNQRVAFGDGSADARQAERRQAQRQELVEPLLFRPRLELEGSMLRLMAR
jgi:hypothetical protein